MHGTNIRVWEIASEKGRVELYPEDTSSLDAVTRGLPQGFYSTFRTFDGGRRVMGLRAHLQRLYQPAKLQQIEPTVSVGILRNHLAEILGACQNEVRLRVAITTKGKILITTQPLKTPPSTTYSHGVKVTTAAIQRQNPRMKSTSFISDSKNMRTQIANSDVFEALLVRNGFILEGMTSNFFYVKGGKLGTARDEVLLGVTRRIVLRVARGSGISILYRPLELKQVPALSEAFITSSSRGVVPVVQIDDMPVGEGMPGSVTKQLSDLYIEYVMRHAEPI